MTSTFAGVGQAAERIEGHRALVQGDVGAHVAVIFEIDLALVENPHRLAHTFGPLARRIAEGRERQKRHARRHAESRRDASGLHGDVGQVFSIGLSRDRGIGDKHHPSAADDNGNADHAAAMLRIENAPDILERRGPIPGDARNHGVRMPMRDHARRKNIAVVVHEPLAIAIEVAVPLEALVKELGIGRVVLGRSALGPRIPPDSRPP